MKIIKNSRNCMQYDLRIIKRPRRTVSTLICLRTSIDSLRADKSGHGESRRRVWTLRSVRWQTVVSADEEV